MTDRCMAKVRGSGTWSRFRHCTRKAKKEGYCTQHHPDSVKKREEEATRKWKEKQDNSVYARLEKALKRNRELEADYKELRDAVKQMKDWRRYHPDDHSYMVAKDIIHNLDELAGKKDGEANS